MAFVNTLNELGQDDQAQKQDIFGGGAQQAQPLAGGIPAGQGVGSGLTKTDVASQVGAGGQSTPTAQKTEAQGTPAAQSAAFQKQVSQATAPKDIGAATGSVRDAKQRQQEAANKFVTEAGNVSQFADPDIEAAISGKQEGQNVKAALSGQRKDVGSFQLPTEDISQAKEFVTEQGGLSEGGLKKMFERGAGPEYNTAMSSFDAALARRNKGLQSQARDLAAAIREKETEEAGLGTSTTEKARAAATAAEDARTKALRDALTAKGSSVMEAAKKRAAEENAARAALREKEKTFGRGEVMKEQVIQDELNRIKEDLAASNPELADYIRRGGADADKYLSLAGDIGEDQALTGEEATRWSNIMDLLGEKSQRKAAGNLGKRASFDENALRASLLEGANIAKGGPGLIGDYSGTGTGSGFTGIGEILGGFDNTFGAKTQAPAPKAAPSQWDMGSYVDKVPKAPGVDRDFQDRLMRSTVVEPTKMISEPTKAASKNVSKSAAEQIFTGNPMNLKKVKW
jgi:hypothetical protein